MTQYAQLKRRSTSTRLHYVISQKAVCQLHMKIWDLTAMKHSILQKVRYFINIWAAVFSSGRTVLHDGCRCCSCRRRSWSPVLRAWTLVGKVWSAFRSPCPPSRTCRSCIWVVTGLAMATWRCWVDFLGSDPSTCPAMLSGIFLQTCCNYSHFLTSTCQTTPSQNCQKKSVASSGNAWSIDRSIDFSFI